MFKLFRMNFLKRLVCTQTAACVLVTGRMWNLALEVCWKNCLWECTFLSVTAN